MTPVSEIKKMKVAELRSELEKRDLSTEGLKADLLQRLLEASTGEEAPAETTTTIEPVPEPAVVAATPPEPIVDADSTQGARKTEEVLTEAEKEAKRAERFGASAAAKPMAKVDPEEDRRRKIERAKRFDVSCPELEEQKRIERAKRFGTSCPELEQQKRVDRAKRFNVADPSLEEAKRASRAERFKLLDEMDPKKARLLGGLKSK